LYRVYRWLTFILEPFVENYLKKRLKRGKEHPQRYLERRGMTVVKRPQGVVVWLHAASVGETQSLLKLMSLLLKYRPNIHLLITTGTVTSAEYLEDKLPERAIHQFIPYDVADWVDRFIENWKPDLALWAESELWPNLIYAIHQRHIPLVLLNAHLSDRSYERWKRMKSVSRFMLGRFSLCLAQSKEQSKRLQNLGAKNVKVTGNIKFSAASLPFEQKHFEDLQQCFSGRSVWLMASTHSGEEKAALYVHQQLKKTYPDLLTIIVPRHPERGGEVVSLAQEHNCVAAQRSCDDSVDSLTDVYVADTLGELGLFYRLSEIVFIGGSLVPIGGHNAIEAAQLDSAVLYGPHMHKARQTDQILKEHKASMQVMTREELSQAVCDLLQDSGKRAEMIKNARYAVESQDKVLDDVYEQLQSYLPPKEDQE